MFTALAYLLTAMEQQSAYSDITDLFKSGTQYLATAVEAVGGLIIGVAVIQAVASVIYALIRRTDNQAVKEAIRLGLGRWLNNVEA